MILKQSVYIYEHIYLKRVVKDCHSNRNVTLWPNFSDFLWAQILDGHAVRKQLFDGFQTMNRDQRIL